MSMIDLGVGLCLPFYMAAGALQARSYALDADGEYAAAVLSIPKTGTLKKIAVRTGTVTTADPINVRLETVDTDTGLPSGTLYATGSSGTISSPSAKTTYWVEINGTTGINVTAQDIVAIKSILDFTDGNLQITNNVYYYSYASFPYTINYLGGVATKVYEAANYGLEYDGEIVPVVGSMPAINISATSFGTQYQKRGLCFQVPFVCSICGVILRIENDYEGQIILYDSDQATPIQTWDMNPNIRASVGQSTYMLALTSPKTLLPFTKYRLVVHNTTGSYFYYHHFTVTDDGSLSTMDSISPGGNWYYTQCDGTPTGEGSWTDTITTRPLFGVILNQIDLFGGLPVLGGSIVK